MPIAEPFEAFRMSKAMGLGMLAGQFSPVFVLAGLIAIVALAVMLYKPDATTLIILFVLYANIAVVATKFYKVPAVIAGGSFMLLTIPIINVVILKKKRSFSMKQIYPGVLVDVCRVLLISLLYFYLERK